MTDTVLVLYGTRIEERADDYFPSVATAINPASLIRDLITPLRVDDEMREIENAAIWDFWNFETTD